MEPLCVGHHLPPSKHRWQVSPASPPPRRPARTTRDSPALARDEFMNHLIINGDARHIPLADNSVHCCVTSPPYYALRDYQTGRWEGGDPQCSHRVGCRVAQTKHPNAANTVAIGIRPGVDASQCRLCGATRIDRQIGLEKTPEQYIAELVSVFREVRRVLRPDGCCWINIGDSYSGYHGNKNSEIPTSATNGWTRGTNENLRTSTANRNGLKEKDLIGIPWMLAFALRADGWYLRSEIIWHKRSPMPESVKDRPTKAHEQVFLLTKSPRYFYDWFAVLERSIHGGATVTLGNKSFSRGQANGAGVKPSGNGKASHYEVATQRNLRSVWSLSGESFRGSHYAVMPSNLARKMIMAGTSEKGCCPVCGASWKRIVTKERIATRPGTNSKVNRASDHEDSPYNGHSGAVVGNRDPLRHATSYVCAGWTPTCQCGIEETAPCIVFDPFSGVGTTCLAAEQLGRNGIGIELGPQYCRMAQRRLNRPHAPIVRERPASRDAAQDDDLPLFRK